MRTRQLILLLTLYCSAVSAAALAQYASDAAPDGPEEAIDMSLFSGWADADHPGTQPLPRRGESRSGARTPHETAPLSVLEGDWRGSGGEWVEIRGHEARLWLNDQRSCHCLFFVYRDRLIAYSPETDVVRKFELHHERDAFSLRDQNGQVMHFRRQH